MNHQYIENQQQLADLIQKMSPVDTLFIDTEFIKRNTYYPILGLLQVNIEPSSDSCFLIDVLALDLTDFWQALFSVRMMVMHACSEDVDILVQEAKKHDVNLPLPQIFDTQIALSFLDYGLQISYQLALEKLLGIHIDKGESCSDWLARPLRPEQLNYAANDVLYLPSLYTKIVNLLQEHSTNIDLHACVLEDTKSLCTDVLMQVPIDALYKEWADFKYSSKQLAQLKQLCTWREQIARQENVPRTFIIKKSSLRDIMVKQPKTMGDLSKINDLRGKNIRLYGDDILINMSDLPDEADFPKRTLRPFKEPTEMGLSDKIKLCIESAVQKTGIPKDVLMRKRWRSKLFEYVALNGHCASSMSNHLELLPDYITGWRYELFIKEVLSLATEEYQEIYQQIIPYEQQHQPS